MKFVVVYRDKTKEKGAGVVKLVNEEEEVLGQWECITGGSKLDPEEYGGLTPPIVWNMVEAIEYRQHPQGHKMTMARIYPMDRDDIETYKNRTFALDAVPFMIHHAGSSTGCIAVYDFEDCKKAINQAWIDNGGYLEIEVFEVAF